MPIIESLYAFITADPAPDDEGIIGYLVPDLGGWVPLVGADMARVESMRPMAEATAKKLGKPVKLVHFTTRVEVEVIEP